MPSAQRMSVEKIENEAGRMFMDTIPPAASSHLTSWLLLMIFSTIYHKQCDFRTPDRDPGKVDYSEALYFTITTQTTVG